MATKSAINRTVFIRDNLEVMRGLNSGSVDLIYLDPPFNSNVDYAAPVGSEAAGAYFKDTWTLDDVKEEWATEIEETSQALHSAVTSAGFIHGQRMQAYLTNMAIRLLEMHRVLKSTGSIYLHCDDTAVHYLKSVMDAIFGAPNYRNHMVWKRATAHNDATRYGRILDHILFYGRTQDVYWDGESARRPKSQAELKAAFPQKSELGPVRFSDLTGPSHGAEFGSPSTQPWNGYDVYSMGRVWAVPKTGNYATYIEDNFIPGYRSIEGIHDRLDALDSAGLIHHPKKGRWPGLKRYAASDRGTPPQNLVLSPTGFTNYNKSSGEYIGYPTQKPLGLLEPLILASSPPQGLVLDPFCGCATTCVAAEKLERRWIGIDLSEKAYDLVVSRLAKEVHVGSSEHPRLTNWRVSKRTDIPLRTDQERRRSRNIKATLYGIQAGYCNGCLEHFRLRNLTIDHIVPLRIGGADVDENLQLLCGACNSVKGDRLTQEELVVELRRQGIRRD